MSDPARHPISLEEIHAYVDHVMSADERTRFEQRLAFDTEASEQVEQWRRQRDALQRYSSTVAQSAPSSEQLVVAGQLERDYARVQATKHYGGLAATVALAFLLGWQAQSLRSDSRQDQVAARTPGVGFVQQAVMAHAVYTPEVRHPVEVAAAEQEHLVQWLSKRLGRALKVPNLSAQGYQLVGGRLLPGDDGARAQFMFQNATQQRITLYVGEVNAAGRSDTAFQFQTSGTTASFYWVDQGFGYALSGNVDRDVLAQIANGVYQQLSAHPTQKSTL